MSFLMSLPAIVRVLLVFIVILVSIRKKLSLGNSFLLGAAFLGLLFGFGPLATVESIVRSVVYPKTLSLAIIVSLILVLSNSMEVTGQMTRMLNEFKGLISNPRANLVVFPSLIGLLPMPGGAVFSAPMVKDLGQHLKLSGPQLSYINYWFRHVWEYSWPLYPGILLATILADINILTFVLYMSPITFLALVLGYLPLRGQKQAFEIQEENNSGASPRPFFRELVPIIIVVFLGLGMGAVFSFLFPELSISKEMGLHLSLCTAILWVWYTNGLPLKQILKLLCSPQILTMIYMVMTIIIFKGILEDSRAARDISRELIQLKVPLALVAMILPFLIGMITGYTLAFVGAALPILIPLIISAGEAAFMFPYMMLVTVCGFLGVLFSPLHLCYILSNQYFNTSFRPVYMYLWIPCAGIFLAGIGYFGLSVWILR